MVDVGIKYGIVFCVSAAFTYLLSLFTHKILPSDRCSHEVPTPTGGGLAIILTAIVASFFLLDGHLFENPGLLIASITLLAGVSLYDDHFGSSYRFRLTIHAICGILVILCGYTIELPYFVEHDIYLVQMLLTIFVVIAFVNATNFIDGLNGLLSGCVMLTLLFALQFENPLSSQLIPILVSSILGFYVFNFPKGKIFMGDVGSTVLGLSLVIIAIFNQGDVLSCSECTLIHKSFFYTLSPMMFLWFDVFFTLSRRIASGRRVTSPYRDYLFHHLNDCGFSHAQVSMIYYVLTLYMGGLTYLAYHDYLPFLGLMIIYMISQIAFLLWVVRRFHALGKSIMQGF